MTPFDTAGWPAFWRALKEKPEVLAEALRTIPRMIAYGWQQEKEGGPYATWFRWDVDEYGCAQATRVPFDEERNGWKVRSGRSDFQWFHSAEDAKRQADNELRLSGWVLIDSMTGPPQ